jgi:hypothetical protein
MSADLDRLQTLLDRLHRLELSIPLPHERSIHDVARAALAQRIRTLSLGLQHGSYWRPHAAAAAALAS